MLTIQDLIDESGKKQEDIAKEAGISPGRLSNWKAGRDELNEEVLLKLCAVLKVSREDLLKARGGIRPVPYQTPASGTVTETVEWLTAAWTNAEFQKAISEAIGQGNSHIAHCLLDVMDRRAGRIQSIEKSGETPHHPPQFPRFVKKPSKG